MATASCKLLQQDDFPEGESDKLYILIYNQ